MEEVILVTSGDPNQSANLICWPAQAEMEQRLARAFREQGVRTRRAFKADPGIGHGFISSQRMGMDIFSKLDRHANLVIATASWQYTHHVLAGLRSHKGPILTVANWSGQWPGSVTLLNLNGSLIKAGVPFSTLWSEDFSDQWFLEGLRKWINTGTIVHDDSHVRDLDPKGLPARSVAMGKFLARGLKVHKAILGVFDEGCMGMYNAIIDDDLLNATGVYKERLSQSALVARMRKVADADAADVRLWLDQAGIRFITGMDESYELTENQLLEQCKMYIAALRIAHEFGCDAIGIQYQQGLRDVVPASDLVEGLLNNRERPPVYDDSTGKELYAGQPLPHFNKVDEGAGLDALITNRCWNFLQLDPATTLHEVCWGEHYCGEGLDDFVWALQISGAAPASHLVNGYRGTTSERQPPMYFPLGGGTLKGVGKPGEIVWSRIFVESGALHADIGLGSVIQLPPEELKRRWTIATPQWPLVSVIFHGIGRNAFMARHRANHVNIAYAIDAASAQNALTVKAAMMFEMGIKVHVCGHVGI